MSYIYDKYISYDMAKVDHWIFSKTKLKYINGTKILKMSLDIWCMILYPSINLKI